MLKLLLALCLAVSATIVCEAQSDRENSRANEWKAYKLPDANFVRRTSPDKSVIVRVPADWKQHGEELTFDGPHSSLLRVVIEKVPEGYPLADYVAAVVRFLDGLPGGSETLLTRRTQFQDLEAREVTVETENAEGDLIRSTSWITVVGPLAATFNIQMPVANAAEIEPYFKALVQSTSFVNPNSFVLLEQHRAALKLDGPRPIREFEELVSGLNELDQNRHDAADKLSALFASNADLGIDLLVDRRTLVRATAIEALTRQNNPALEPLLWDAIGDRELIVAEIAARKIAQLPDLPTKLLDHSLSGFDTDVIARVWPFMSRPARIQLLKTVFSQAAIAPPSNPPAAKAKPGVSVVVKELKVGVSSIPMGTQDPNVQLSFLTLMVDTPIEDYRLPLNTLMASHYDPLVIVGLQVANFRCESLPLEPLLKLLSSANETVQALAAQNLVYSATVSDGPRVEAAMAKTAGNKLIDINLLGKRMRLRQQLDAARKSGQTENEVLKSVSDSSLVAFAKQYLATTTQFSGKGIEPKSDFNVSPLAENLLPKEVAHYLAIPNPAQAVERLYNSFRSIQMESPRAQANLVLAMGGTRQVLGLHLNAPPEATSLIDYTGLQPDSPITLADWTPRGLNLSSSSKRKAFIVHVKDRQRFERVLGALHNSIGDVTNFGDYLAIISRALVIMPAVLPETAKRFLTQLPGEKADTSLLKYSSIGYTKVGTVDVKVFLQRKLDAKWTLQTESTYLAFIGDTAIVGTNLETVSELLTQASAAANAEHLGDNGEFKKASADSGDVIYFSDVRSILARYGDSVKDESAQIKESGTLRISNSSWDNFHRIEFTDQSWSKNLQTLHPRDLSAPKDLLPSSTIAYLFMNPNPTAIWKEWASSFFGQTKAEALGSIWASELKEDLASELGPECGVAALEMPEFERLDQLNWTAFCQLKSNKIADAFTAGKLFAGVGPTADIAEIKAGGNSYFAAVRQGFLVITNHRNDLNLLNQKPALATSRDYFRAAEKVPDQVLVFGGYNLEAAVAAARKGASSDGLSAQIANVVFSLAGAFHSQHFYATGSAEAMQAKSSVAMDLEGKYAVADFSYSPHAGNITFATLEPRGVSIVDQNRISRLVIKVHSKNPGPIQDIKDDVSTPEQTVEEKTPTELIVKVAARRPVVDTKVLLPVTDPTLSEYLKASGEISSDNKQVIDQAREIAGKDKDAWSVARKLADWTYKNLTWRSVAVANASQTLATREADCSEFSQLYVSMARAVGLPARIVSGLAYGGASFGGHAWVEVWVGRWVELDPTWGTDFVDATHIRNSSSALVTAAALNLVDLEILEANRTPAEFQQSAAALAKEFTRGVASGDRSAIDATFDLRVLTNELMGAGEWEQMTEPEHRQILAGYKRAMLELFLDYGKVAGESKFRLIDVVTQGERAEAVCRSGSDHLVKLQLIKRNDRWHMLDVIDRDAGLQIIGESVKPYIQWIRKTRAGDKPTSVPRSNLVRALLISPSNPTKSLELVETSLKSDPTNQDLKFLKAKLLTRLKKEDEGLALFRQLVDEQPSYPAAIRELGSRLWIKFSDKDEKATELKQVLELYQQYARVEPLDPEAHTWLAGLYSRSNELELAKAEYWKALNLDPNNESGYIDLVEFLMENNLIKEVPAVLDVGDKHPEAGTDLFGSIMSNLYELDLFDEVEQLAAMQPRRMQKSIAANITLGQSLIDNDKALKALAPLNFALSLDSSSIEARIELVYANRALSRWPVALRAAQQVLNLEPENGEAHYLRACVLARTGKTTEAMSELSKSIELEPHRLYFFSDETDFKSLTALPAYTKLVAEAEKKKAEEKEEP